MPRNTIIQLDQERELRYNVAAVSRLERELGESVFSFIQDNNTSFYYVHVALWAGLKHPDELPGLTLDGAAQLLEEGIEENGYAETVSTIAQALLTSGIVQKMQDQQSGNEQSGGKAGEKSQEEEEND